MKTDCGYGCTSGRYLMLLDSHLKHFKEWNVCIMWIFLPLEKRIGKNISEKACYNDYCQKSHG